MGFLGPSACAPDGALCALTMWKRHRKARACKPSGNDKGFAVTTFGPSDSCSEGGQRLSGADYGWAWTSSNPTTAFLMSDGILDLGAAPGLQCAVRALGLASRHLGVRQRSGGVRRAVRWRQRVAGRRMLGGLCGKERRPVCLMTTRSRLSPQTAVATARRRHSKNAMTAIVRMATAARLLVPNEGASAVGSVCGNGPWPTTLRSAEKSATTATTPRATAVQINVSGRI